MEYTTKTFTYPESVVRVHIPELTEEERNRRMKAVEKAACRLLRGQINEKKKVKKQS